LEGTFEKYDGHFKTYHGYNHQHKNIIIAMDVKFDEMFIVIPKVVKPNLLLWLTTNEFMPHRQIHIEIHVLEETPINLRLHISSLKSNGLQYHGENCPNNVDLKDHFS
jgi:hypothetical protein